MLEKNYIRWYNIFITQYVFNTKYDQEALVMPSESTTTKLPSGSKEFYEAVNRLKNPDPNCSNRFEMASHCCKLCTNANEIACEECYVQTVGDLSDPYRKKIESNTLTGMYSSGIYKDKDGKYRYTHPQGSG